MWILTCGHVGLLWHFVLLLLVPVVRLPLLHLGHLCQLLGVVCPRVESRRRLVAWVQYNNACTGWSRLLAAATNTKPTSPTPTPTPLMLGKVDGNVDLDLLIFTTHVAVLSISQIYIGDLY